MFNVQDQIAALQKLAQGTFSAEGQAMDWTYYDRLLLAAAGTSFTMFQNPLGSGAVPRTLADTNMTTAGIIPTNQNFTVFAIIVGYEAHAQLASATIDILNNWLRTVTVSLTINGKAPTFQKPLTEILGIPMLIHNEPAVTVSGVMGSQGRFTGISPLNIPITLAANSNFNVIVEYPAAIGATAIVADYLRIGLNGALIRAS